MTKIPLYMYILAVRYNVSNNISCKLNRNEFYKWTCQFGGNDRNTVVKLKILSDFLSHIAYASVNPKCSVAYRPSSWIGMLLVHFNNVRHTASELATVIVFGPATDLIATLFKPPRASRDSVLRASDSISNSLRSALLEN